MTRAIALRTDHDADDLRLLSRSSCDSNPVENKGNGLGFPANSSTTRQ